MRRARRARPAVTAVLAAALLALAGCTATVAGTPVAAGSGSGSGSAGDQDRGLVEEYYDELNASGDEGAATQREFLRRTQHPDYADELCDLGDLTLHVEPAMSTLRVDPDWVPPGDGGDSARPSGLVYVLGVSITIRQDGALLGEQIGSQRVVVLDGRAYGFAPCPTG
jgi:hypothetical protein